MYLTFIHIYFLIQKTKEYNFVYDFNHVFLETIKRAYKEMKKPLICIAYKIVDDTSDYANKILFKRELFKLKIPVFESVELAAKALDKMCTFREFQNDHNRF